MELTATTLTHPAVRLEPFEPRHRAGLIAAAHADLGIFRHMPFPVAAQGYGAWFDVLLNEQAAGRWLPFAVIAMFSPPFTGEVASDSEPEGANPSDVCASPLSHAARDSSPASGGANQGIVGQSCYLNPRPRDACVEIGGTWYVSDAQATAINPAAKLLLLDHAFAAGAERVEMKTDALNEQSRAAMLKLGCSFEGVMRRQMRRPDGSWRDNAWYSILRQEWPVVKAKLETRLAAF